MNWAQKLCSNTFFQHFCCFCMVQDITRRAVQNCKHHSSLCRLPVTTLLFRAACLFDTHTHVKDLLPVVPLGDVVRSVPADKAFKVRFFQFIHTLQSIEKLFCFNILMNLMKTEKFSSTLKICMNVSLRRHNT